MRRFRPNCLYGLRNGIWPALKSLGASVGISAALVTLPGAAGMTIPLALLYLIVGVCVTIFVGVLVFKSRSEHLPDIVTDENNDDGLYEVTLCDEATLREANAMTKRYYRGEYVSDDVAEKWRKKNPRGFVSIRNDRQELCAAFGVLAMEESFFAHFFKGRVLDNELEPDDILGFKQSKKSSKLYISGVVVRDPESIQGRRRACVMVWVMLEYLRRIYGSKQQRTVYALAVSKTSENMLRRYGFTVVSPRKFRRDGLDLYSLHLTSGVMSELEGRIGDWSKSVRSSRFSPPRN